MVKNYFTDALIYQEASKALKEPLPDDDNNDNKADSESEGNTPATLTCELIVAYFNNPQCNNTIRDGDEWVINENVTFDYPESVKLFESVYNSSLHMLLPVLSTTSTPVECGEGSVFVVPSSKRSQSLIVFGRPTNVCSHRFEFKLGAPVIFPLCMINTPYDAKNGIQSTAWERFELQKRTTRSFMDFRAKREASKLL